MGTYRYLTDISNLTVELAEKNTVWIEMHRLGRWYHPKHGWIEGTKEKFKSFIDNWKNNVLGRKIIFDKNHKPDDGGTGFLQDMKIEGDRLKGQVKFTPFGLDLVKNKGFIYFSPEYTDKYTSKDTKKELGPTLKGGAVTLRPFLTNLAPVVLAEGIQDAAYYPHSALSHIDTQLLIKEVVRELARDRGVPVSQLVVELSRALENMQMEME